MKAVVMEYIFEKLRCCSNCGSSFSNYKTLLCAKCYLLCEEDAEAAPFVRTSDGNQQIGGYCLWRWIPGKNEALSALLSTIKGGSQKKAFLGFAERLVQQRLCLDSYNNSEAILVPAPASELGATDHAWRLAHSLSIVTGFPIGEVLEKKTKHHQRDLGMHNRKEIQLGLIENFSTNLILDKNVIFVDDVVTTGATALAAKANLRNCKTFEVWCLAQREPCSNE